MIGTLITKLEDLKPGDFFYRRELNPRIYFIVSKSDSTIPDHYILHKGKLSKHQLTVVTNGYFYRVEL